MTAAKGRWAVYLAAAGIGAAAALGIMPWAAITGSGAGWHPPFPDQAQALAAHLAFQADRWRWPLLDVGTLFWPRTVSGALADFNPLLSLAAKIWTTASGGGPVNLFGAWMAACWMLQPMATVYAARGLGIRLAGAVTCGVLAACAPVLLARTGHLNLCAHFLILAALGLVFRRLDHRGGWIAPAGVMLFAILVHPYLFQLTAALFAAIPLQALLSRRPHWRREAAGYAVSGCAAAGLFVVLTGVTGGKEAGYSFFSMNLLSPIWPQRSGVFGATLPVIDATGGQYEGFNWLGAGVLLLGVAAVAMAGARLLGLRRVVPASPRRPMAALAIVLAGLAAFSLSSRVYAGSVRLLDLGAQPWDDLFGTFRVSGRAFWPVGYAIMLFAVARVQTLPHLAGGLLLAAGCGLQIVDAQPLRAAARAAWTVGDTIATPPIPPGTTLFTAAPYAGCGNDLAIGEQEPIMILAAIRAGARTGQIGLGRRPKWFACTRIDSDALELPMAQGEVRAFFGAPLQRRLRTDLLGPQAGCRQLADAVLCGRGVPLPEGSAVSPGAALARLDYGETHGVAPLTPLLATGWAVSAASGEIWSDGARSTLAMAVPANTALVVSLRLHGVGTAFGPRRILHLLVGRDARGQALLRDDAETTLDLLVSSGDLPDGILRVAIDIEGHIDPRKYRIAAPVARAAIQLDGIALRRG